MKHIEQICQNCTYYARRIKMCMYRDIYVSRKNNCYRFLVAPTTYERLGDEELIERERDLELQRDAKMKQDDIFAWLELGYFERAVALKTIQKKFNISLEDAEAVLYEYEYKQLAIQAGRDDTHIVRYVL